MDITYLGHSSFKIKTKSASVVTDPFDPKFLGLKFSPTDAEIITVSHSHQDHNFTEKITGVKKVLTSPGEYEIAGVSIMAYRTYHDNKKGEDKGKNTIYVFDVDGLSVVHLGDLGHTLSEGLIDEIGDVDVLLIPVGGFYTIGPKEASEIVSKLEPYYVIPMHYKAEGMNPEIATNLLPVEDFLKESGLTVETLPKFSIKKDDILEDQTTKIVVLERK